MLLIIYKGKMRGHLQIVLRMNLSMTEYDGFGSFVYLVMSNYVQDMVSLGMGHSFWYIQSVDSLYHMPCAQITYHSHSYFRPWFSTFLTYLCLSWPFPSEILDGVPISLLAMDELEYWNLCTCRPTRIPPSHATFFCTRPYEHVFMHPALKKKTSFFHRLNSWPSQIYLQHCNMYTHPAINRLNSYTLMMSSARPPLRESGGWVHDFENYKKPKAWQFTGTIKAFNFSSFPINQKWKLRNALSHLVCLDGLAPALCSAGYMSKAWSIPDRPPPSVPTFFLMRFRVRILVLSGNNGLRSRVLG